MPRFEVTWAVDLPDDPGTLTEIEEAVASRLNELARELTARLIEAQEPAVLEQAGGARQRLTGRYVTTRFGDVRYERWKVRTAAGYSCPLDAALGLERGQTLSPWLLAELSHLAQRLPFRQAADVATRLLGLDVSVGRAWRAAQEGGRRVRRAHERGRGGPPEDLPGDAHAHEMVVVELDGTGLRLNDGTVTEAKLAVWWTGKRVVHTGRGARRRRAYLARKGAYASMQPGEAFNVTASRLCQRHVRHRHARHRLAVSDAGTWIPNAVAAIWQITDHQLDHFHARRFVDGLPGFTDRQRRWLWGWLRDGDTAGVLREVDQALADRRMGTEEHRLARAYLRHAGKLHAAAALAGRGAPADCCTPYSGGVEHNVELVINRRMKKRGMRWSREGAGNMLALRCCALNDDGWREVFAA